MTLASKKTYISLSQPKKTPQILQVISMVSILKSATEKSSKGLRLFILYNPNPTRFLLLSKGPFTIIKPAEPKKG
jgi:hypothetical protein